MKFIYWIRILPFLSFLLVGCTYPTPSSNTLLPSLVSEPTPVLSAVSPSSDPSLCPIMREKKHLEGNSMEPMMKNGSWTTLLKGYYDCGLVLPQKGDVVAGIYGGNTLPLIKVVVATSEDQVEIVNKKLVVNGKEVKNSANQEYPFSDAELKMFALYITNKKIPEKTVFLLGDNVHNSIDSRKFGAISVSNIIGKFEIL